MSECVLLLCQNVLFEIHYSQNSKSPDFLSSICGINILETNFMIFIFHKTKTTDYSGQLVSIPVKQYVIILGNI